jgi:preprotein translocase subunit SecG
MFAFLTILLVIISLFVILIVLIQNPKGNAMTSGFAGAASNIIGVQKTGDVLEKATWGSMGLLLFIAFVTVFFMPKAKEGVQQKSKTEQLMTVPSAPVAPQGIAPMTPSGEQGAPQALPGGEE